MIHDSLTGLMIGRLIGQGTTAEGEEATTWPFSLQYIFLGFLTWWFHDSRVGKAQCPSSITYVRLVVVPMAKLRVTGGPSTGRVNTECMIILQAIAANIGHIWALFLGIGMFTGMVSKFVFWRFMSCVSPNLFPLGILD